MRITLVCADDDRWAVGVRSISAALVSAGHRMRMVFSCPADGAISAPVLDTIASLARDSELIGISSMSRASKRAKAIIEALRPLGAPIVWGGMHPTLYPEDCVGHADMICRGEGEEFMIELAERLAAGKGYRDIRNGAYVLDGRLVMNDMRPLISDLDRLPLLDVSFADEVNVDRDGTIHPGAEMAGATNVFFTGARGCQYNCHYCSNSQLKRLYGGNGHFVRKLSVGRLIESLVEFRKSFPGARSFYFTDEDFFSRPLEDLRSFAAEYSRTVGLPFECMASPQQITAEKTEALVAAGMWRVDVGVESGSDRVKREILNRPVSNAVVMRAASILNDHPGLVAYYFFIIGNPYETREDLLQTIDLISRLPFPFFIRTYSLVFMPGTILFEKARADGIIRGLEDCGYEIDFLAGYDYKGQPWKRKNLYLNGLVSLMTGKTKRGRLGFIPRFLLPVLLHSRVIDYNERHPAISKGLVSAARRGLAARRRILEVGMKVLKSPGSVHNFTARSIRPRGASTISKQ